MCTAIDDVHVHVYVHVFVPATIYFVKKNVCKLDLFSHNALGYMYIYSETFISDINLCNAAKQKARKEIASFVYMAISKNQRGNRNIMTA